MRLKEEKLIAREKGTAGKIRADEAMVGC